jgi:beta-apo-4'-carotenal oxygenase
MHGSVSTLPFGGVGESGTGAYHGQTGFDCFTHRRTLVEVPSWMEKLLRVRYLPYSASELRRFTKMNAVTPDFDRDGQPIRGLRYWVYMLFGLGGPSVKGALIRWMVLLASGYATVKYNPSLIERFSGA